MCAKTMGNAMNRVERLFDEWCDALRSLQLSGTGSARLDGAIACPACGRIHGRCADAMYPFLQRARATGDECWIRSAKALFAWTEAVVSRESGAVLNDIDSSWDGITVFYADVLARCLTDFGDLLDGETRQAWKGRLRLALDYLAEYTALNENNVNYTIGCALALAEGAAVLGEERFSAAARSFMDLALGSITPSGLLYGEGVPRETVTLAGCRPVDIGYNVEESLPMLVRYGRLGGDERVMALLRRAFAAHLDFLLPDGGWDNSFGTRKFKWTYWGSRTTDGAIAALLELSERSGDAFSLAAQAQLDMLEACTHAGLLAGGPHLVSAGQPICVHHTFEHAKVLAEVLAQGLGKKLPAAGEKPGPSGVSAVPRLSRRGWRFYPELRTWVGSFGKVSATLTAYDFEYLPGGHTSGGTISLLHHGELGPLLCASVGEYVRRERNNMQVPVHAHHECLTPRVEMEVEGRVYSSMYEEAPTVEAVGAAFEVSGELKDKEHCRAPLGDGRYLIRYALNDQGLEIDAQVPPEARLVVPIVSMGCEDVVIGGRGDGVSAMVPHHALSPGEVRVEKHAGRVAARVETGALELPYGRERIFNLVPGLEALRVDVAPCDGRVHFFLTW